jgi:hypothetical protein
MKQEFMKAIILEPKNEAELKAIEELATKLGIDSFTITEKTRQHLAGIKMVEIAEKHPKYDLSDEEIMNLFHEDEEEFYKKK